MITIRRYRLILTMLSDMFGEQNSLVGQGDIANAIVDYDQAIGTAPAYAPAYNGRGIARQRTRCA